MTEWEAIVCKAKPLRTGMLGSGREIVTAWPLRRPAMRLGRPRRVAEKVWKPP